MFADSDSTIQLPQGKFNKPCSKTEGARDRVVSKLQNMDTLNIRTLRSFNLKLLVSKASHSLKLAAKGVHIDIVIRVYSLHLSEKVKLKVRIQ